MGLHNMIIMGDCGCSCSSCRHVGKVVKTKGKDDVKVASAMAIFDRLKAAYQATGLPPRIVDWALIRDWMESGAFTNKGYRLYNNPGSLMWPPRGLKYGSKGGLCTSNNTCFAQFRDLDEYARQAAIELRKAPGKPADATDNRDFVRRLKLNRYMGNESEDSYWNKMKAAAARINLLAKFHEDIHQDVQAPDKKTNPLIWLTVGILGLMAAGSIFKAARD